MTDVEKRRLKLLEETRKTYNEKYAPPAIHPRYHSTYQNLYGLKDEESMEQKPTFFIRLFLSMLIFGIIFFMNYEKDNFNFVDQQMIINEIQKSFSQSFPNLIK